MKILAATTVRNEAPYLLEWVAWHQLIGVTDILVYSNDCEDGTDRMLDLLAEQGVLTHERTERAPERSIQWSALNAAWKHPMRKAADWMLISDLDEFPVIHVGDGRLGDLLAALPGNTDAVALGWRLFGANGIVALADRAVTGQFTRSAPADMIQPIAATFFKSLFRPAAFSRPGVHRPRHRKDNQPVWVDGSGHALPPIIAGNDKRLSLVGVPDYRQLAEMHHYSLRSVQGFMTKAERGLPNRADKAIDLGYWIDRNFNSVENLAAQRMLPQLTRHIETLKALPGIASLHEAALGWHRDRFAAIVKTQAGYDLFGQLVHAHDSIVLPPALQRQLLRMFGSVADPDRSLQ
ncbi:glycosyltransferase family 2 protein [Paracoccus aurantiacus]|uniref:Glycosyltransferase family 2 protein n=1 Tax=Paracoccus aurantiacus TaxID=2599412 RepID=A0A5C6RZY7_9RHOB|nr:glycosyltransferase family 2 protein [Paracoccus aurantiacus]TXB67871.1 glycosyltransferase family 2 protein [Paracoccus aurantiacus]